MPTLERLGHTNVSKDMNVTHNKTANKTKITLKNHLSGLEGWNY